jgi:N-acetylmuramoyl-L-alanine amidase
VKIMRLLAVTGALAVAACSCASSEHDATATSVEGADASTTTSTSAPASTVPLAPVTTAALVDPVDARVLVTPTGVAVPVLGHDAAGYRVRTPCEGEATVAGGTPFAEVDVVLDPGHGGSERGAIGPSGLEEKHVNLAVAERARDRLVAAGYTVLLTRTTDHQMALSTRAEIANRLDASAFVSVHHNADPDGPSADPGSETYFQVASPDSKRLAGLLYEEILGALAGYEVEWVSDRDAGAKHRTNSRGGDYYGVLRETAGVPAVLTEAAFISNADEEALLADPEVVAEEGDAIAVAIVRYLSSDDPGSGFVEPEPREEPAGPGGRDVECVDPPLV